MNTQLKQLYQQTLLKHSKQPQHQGKPQTESDSATIRNPLCGDEITIYRSRSDGQLSFEGKCCAICTASASMMIDHLQSLPSNEQNEQASTFVSRFQSHSEELDFPGDLSALKGVWEFPSRIRCATLPWEALRDLGS